MILFDILVLGLTFLGVSLSLSATDSYSGSTAITISIIRTGAYRWTGELQWPEILYLHIILRYVHSVLRTSDHSKIVRWQYDNCWRVAKARCLLKSGGVHYLKLGCYCPQPKGICCKLQSWDRLWEHSPVTRNWCALFHIKKWVRTRRRLWLPIQEGDFEHEGKPNEDHLQRNLSTGLKRIGDRPTRTFSQIYYCVNNLENECWKMAPWISHSTKDLPGIWPIYTTKV